MTSPIRNLAVLRDAALTRHNRIGGLPLSAGTNEAIDNAASRTLSQIESLAQAMLAETPETMDDVLSLLVVMEDVFDDYRATEPGSNQRDEFELRMDAGLVACALAVARLAERDYDVTDLEHNALGRMDRRRQIWAPVPNDEWTGALQVYLQTKASEDASADDDPNADELTEKRAAAEDVLMVIPAPDADALALKFSIARRDGRDAHWWNSILDADAIRLATRGR